MFSRAAKSIVQSINQRGYHATRANFKAAVGSTGEVGNSTSQFSQRTGKLDSSAAQEIIPFKNLKFKNITPTTPEGQTLTSGIGARAADGLAAEGNVQAVDLAQLRGLGHILSSANSTPGFYRVPMKASSEHGDHVRNDDYFPQGEEYEDEIGSEGFIRPVYSHPPQQRLSRYRERVDDFDDSK